DARQHEVPARIIATCLCMETSGKRPPCSWGKRSTPTQRPCRHGARREDKERLCFRMHSQAGRRGLSKPIAELRALSRSSRGLASIAMTGDVAQLDRCGPCECVEKSQRNSIHATTSNAGGLRDCGAAGVRARARCISSKRDFCGLVVAAKAAVERDD